MSKYSITRDKYCFTVHEHKLIKEKDSKNYGKERVEVVGYYSNLETLLQKLLFLEADIDYNDITNCINAAIASLIKNLENTKIGEKENG